MRNAWNILVILLLSLSVAACGSSKSSHPADGDLESDNPCPDGKILGQDGFCHDPVVDGDQEAGDPPETDLDSDLDSDGDLDITEHVDLDEESPDRTDPDDAVGEDGEPVEEGAPDGDPADQPDGDPVESDIDLTDRENEINEEDSVDTTDSPGDSPDAPFDADQQCQTTLDCEIGVCSPSTHTCMIQCFENIDCDPLCCTHGRCESCVPDGDEEEGPVEVQCAPEGSGGSAFDDECPNKYICNALGWCEAGCTGNASCMEGYYCEEDSHPRCRLIPEPEGE